ncbi:hypothetical protein ACWD04_12045 [Streptomyces sp. NPDC002911]
MTPSVSRIRPGYGDDARNLRSGVGVQRTPPDDEAQPTKWTFSVGGPGLEADLTVSLTSDS